MNLHDKVGLRQLALRNALLSKKTKIEARRERILSEVNKMVAERRSLDTKLTMLDELLRSRGGTPAGTLTPAPVPVLAAPRPTGGKAPAPTVEITIPEGPVPPPPPPPPESAIRDRLVSAVQERYRETDFGIQDFHALMNDLSPQASFKFETAWRVCNDFVTRRVIKQVSQQITEKGLVRRFKAV